MTVFGFTGTRRWPTTCQQTWLFNRLRATHMTEFHHGCCVGSDQLAHMIAVEHFRVMGATGRPVKGHPPSKEGWMMPLIEDDLVEYMEPYEYLTRNTHIVKAADQMLAMPDGFTEIARGSGTWSTIRETLRLHKTVEICYPDGTVEVKGP